MSDGDRNHDRSSYKSGGKSSSSTFNSNRCLFRSSLLLYHHHLFSRRTLPPRLLRRRRLGAALPREGGRGGRGRRGARRGEGDRRARRRRSDDAADDDLDDTKPKLAAAEQKVLPPRPVPRLGLGRRPPPDAGAAVLWGIIGAGDEDVAVAGVEAAGEVVEFFLVFLFLFFPFGFFFFFFLFSFFLSTSTSFEKPKTPKAPGRRAHPAAPLDRLIDSPRVRALGRGPALGDARRRHDLRAALGDQERGRSGELLFSAAARGLGRLDARLDLRGDAPFLARDFRGSSEGERGGSL